MSATDRKTPPATRGPIPHRGRAWLLGVALPILTTAAAWIYIATAVPRLPDTVAVHWGVSGADRFGPVSELLIVGAVLCVVSLLITCPLAVLTGRQSLTRRLVVGISAGMAVMASGMTLSVVRVNLTDPPGDPITMMMLAVCAGLVIGVAAGAAAGEDPIVRATEPVPAHAPRARLSASERAVWVRDTGVRPAVLYGTLAVVVGTGVLVGIVGTWLAAALITVPIVLLQLAFMRYRVRVDADGLTARSYLGFPVLRARADEVVEARVIDVHPMNEYGGWGLRTSPSGTVGLVTRKGPAIEVRRTGDRIQVITVDDAGRGTALLNTMAERARPVSRVEDSPLGSAAEVRRGPDIELRGGAAGGRGHEMRPGSGSMGPDEPLR